MTSEIKREEGIGKCKIGCKVVDQNTVVVCRNIAQVAIRSMAPSWYAEMLHSLQTGVWYLVGTQECYTSSNQVVRRKVKV